MSGELDVLALCKLALAGRGDELQAALTKEPDSSRRSPHVAAALADVAALEAQLAGDPGLARSKVGPGIEPLLVLCHSRVAAGKTRAEAARVLVAAGADGSASAPDGDMPDGRATCLSGAAGVSGDVELVRALLDGGAAPNDGAALFAAVTAKSWDAGDAIVAGGGDWDAAEPGGLWTPLHWMLDRAWARSSLDALLDRGVDVNRAVGPLGQTPLFVAALRRRREPLAPLVAAGADPNARTTGGMTPWRHAVRRTFTEVADELARLGAETELTDADELALELWDGRLDSARARLSARPELARSAPPEEARLLPDLAAAGRVDAVAVLLDGGADVTARGLDEGTALHQAAWFGQPAMARFLLARGAPLDVRGDDHDSTPLGWVAHGSRWSGGADGRQHAYLEVADALLDAGALVPGPGEPDAPQIAGASDRVRERISARARRD